MKNTLIFIIYLKFLSIALSINLSKEDENNLPVYQPFPSAIINPLTICPQGLVSSIAPFNVNYGRFVAFSLMSCGVYIYNITDLLQPSLVFSDILNSQGNTQGLKTSHGQTFLWITHSTGNFYGMDLTKFPLTITIRSHSNNNILINKIQPWPNNNDILFLFCNSMFQIFDWREKLEEIRYLQSVNVNAVNSKSIQFLRQNQYALINAPNKGVQFYLVANGDDIDNINFTYSCVLKPYFYDVSDFVLMDDNTIAVLMLYKGIFLYSMSNYFTNQGNSCTPNSFTYITQTPNQGLGGRLQLSSNKKFLYAAYRVVGIKIYDVSQRQLQIVQEIKIDANCKDLILSDQEDLIYYSNSLTLQIFQRTSPNFNRDIPNLLLNTYQISRYSWFKDGPEGNADYQCVWREDQKQLFLVRAIFGIQLFQYAGNGILEGTSTIYKVGNPYPINQLKFLPDGVTAYLSRSGAGFTIVDYSNLSAPKILKEQVNMKSQFVYFSAFEFLKGNTVGIVTNAINLIIFSIEDPLNPTMISIIDTMKYTQGDVTASRILITKDETTLLICQSSLGVISTDISDLNNPIIKSNFFQDGISDVKMTSDEQYIVAAGNYQGLFVLKLIGDKQIIFVSKVTVIGNLYRLQILNDSYVIVTSYEDPAVSLISIKDIKNPKVIQRFGNDSKVSFGYYFLCLSKDQTEMFVTSQLALFNLSLQNQIILHSQIYMLVNQENSNEFVRLALKDGASLRIGQNIEIHLVSIYQTQEIQIRKAFYYEEYVLQELPFWMTFFQSDKILRLSITKDSLKKDSQGNYIDTVQQVVFLTYQTLQTNVFVNSYLDITLSDSKQLYQVCVKEGYIDKLGYISQNYSPQSEINLGAKEDQYLAKWPGAKQSLVKQFIQYTLNQNIINYTTQFTVSQSLSVDLKNINQVIFTQQSDVIVQMSVLEQHLETQIAPTNKAKFVKKNYSGVLVLLSDKQDELKIEGSLKNVNQVLKDGIKFAFDEKVISSDKIFIQITISDGVNYNYEDLVAYKNLLFLKKQAPIVVSETFNLQKDVFQKYQGGNIFIQENFQYQISSSVFTSLDEKSLIYSAKMNINGEYQDIPKDFWMQYSSSDRVFTGTPLATDYKNKVTIQVNATDGYSYNTDTFTINPSKVPFSYAFQMMIQVLGPVFGLFGFYKYKHFIYNVTFKQKYLYTKDVAYVGEVYRKQITITDNTREQALRLWKFLFNRLGEYQFRFELNSQKQLSTLISSHEFYNPQQSTSDQDKEKLQEQQEDRLNFEDEVSKKMYPYGVNTEEICFVDKKVKHLILQHSLRFLDEMGNSSNTISNYDLIQPSTIRQDRGLTQEPEKSKIQNQEQENGINSSRKTSIFKKQLTSKIFQMRPIVDNIKHGMEINDSVLRLKHMDQKEEQLSPIKKELKLRAQNLSIFDEKGKINTIEILRFIREEQSIVQEKQRIASINDMKNLENPTSILSQAIISLLVEYLLSLDKVTKSIFEFMHQKALLFYKEIDWYKAYVNIKPQFEEIHTNPYPLITINEQTTKVALKEIFRSLKRYFFDPLTKSPKEIKFSMMLIEENIKSKAIGFSKQSPGFLTVSQGESIHAFSHTIHSLKSFQKNNDITYCMTLYKKLDLHYQEKGLTDNQRLPSWIHSIDLINGAIMVSGIPEKKDIGSIFLKVIDQDQYILRSYEIQVLQKLSEEPLFMRKQESKSYDNVNANFIGISNSDKNMNKSQKFSAFARKDEFKNNDISEISNIGQAQELQQIHEETNLKKFNDIELQNHPLEVVDSFIKPSQIYLEKPQEKLCQLDETFHNDNSFYVSQNDIYRNQDRSNNSNNRSQYEENIN